VKKPDIMYAISKTVHPISIMNPYSALTSEVIIMQGKNIISHKDVGTDFGRQEVLLLCEQSV
jgi:hypothetical protein